MKKYYKDFYGCKASTEEKIDGCKLIITSSEGKIIYNKVLKSERACKQVMSRHSDGTMKPV